MIKKLLLIACTSLLFSMPLVAQEIGKPAPTFKLKDTHGTEHSLSDFKGKFVVLEWHNAECPFVVKHYASNNMQKLQEAYIAKDVIWLTINSSAEGKQGHLTPILANDLLKQVNSKATAMLLDPEGTVGKAYAATTTPNMYVINPEGTLIYSGAIDSESSTNQKDIPSATNYVAQALDEAMAGKTVSTSNTDPYGCSIKYASKGLLGMG